MNLFKMLNLCVSHLRRRDSPTTGSVYAYLIEDIFLCLKFTERQDAIFYHVQQLNCKCIWRGTFEIKSIVVMVSDDINDEHQKKNTDTHMNMHTKRFDITLRYGINFKKVLKC